VIHFSSCGSGFVGTGFPDDASRYRKGQRMTDAEEDNNRLAADLKAEPTLFDHRSHVLMRGDLFAVLDYSGNVAFGEQGLFFQEARHLSKFLISIRGKHLLLLDAEVRSDNAILWVDITNPDVRWRDTELSRGTVHLKRTKFLLGSTCYEKFEIQNYNRHAVTFELLFQFAADFADIFEVRGYQRRRPGRALEAEITSSAITLGYEGLDGIVRTTRLETSIRPTGFSSSAFCVPLTLQPQDRNAFSFRIICGADRSNKSFPYGRAYEALKSPVRQDEECKADISTSNEQFNQWLDRSHADLKMLTTLTPDGRMLISTPDMYRSSRGVRIGWLPSRWQLQCVVTF
jgi:glycogen debranching enzyme